MNTLAQQVALRLDEDVWYSNMHPIPDVKRTVWSKIVLVKQQAFHLDKGAVWYNTMHSSPGKTIRVDKDCS